MAGCARAAGRRGGDGTTATTTPGNQAVPGGGQGPAPPGGPLDDRGDLETGAPERVEPPPVDDGSSFPPFRLGQALLGLALCIMLYLVLVPLGLVVQHALRRHRARAPSERVGLAWYETNERMRAAGLQLDPALTIAERAARMRLALPGAAGAIDVLAGSIERVTYGEVIPRPDEVASAADASAAIVTAAAQRQPWTRRVRAYLDIRRLWPEPDQARRTAHVAQASGSRSGSFTPVSPQR